MAATFGGTSKKQKPRRQNSVLGSILGPAFERPQTANSAGLSRSGSSKSLPQSQVQPAVAGNHVGGSFADVVNLTMMGQRDADRAR